MATQQKTFSGQDIADALGVPGIQLRRYIRSDGTRVGRGRTYKFTAEEATAIAEGFAAPENDEQKAELTAALAEAGIAPAAPEALNIAGSRGE